MIFTLFPEKGVYSKGKKYLPHGTNDPLQNTYIGHVVLITFRYLLQIGIYIQLTTLLGICRFAYALIPLLESQSRNSSLYSESLVRKQKQRHTLSFFNRIHETDIANRLA